MPTVTESQPSAAESAAKLDPKASSEAASEAALRIRYRIRFAKEGLLRWISHRDLARLWERLLRRGQFQLSMTEGFHPKPRVAFPSALALGVEGLDEVVEIELAEDLTPREVLERMQADNQPGLTVHRVGKLPDAFGKAQLQRSDYTISVIQSADRALVLSAIERLLAQSFVTVERKKKPMKVAVAAQILRLEMIDQTLHLSLAASESASLRPADVLDLLGLGDWIELGSQITRVGVFLHKDIDSDDPRVVAVASRAQGPLADTASSTIQADHET